MAEETFNKIVKKVTVSIPMSVCTQNWPQFDKQRISRQLIESIGGISRVAPNGVRHTVAISYLPKAGQERYLITYNVILDEAVTQAIHMNFTKFPIF